MVRWQRHFGPAAPGVVSVNVSSIQFAGASLASDIEAILRETGLQGSNLKLEITESAFIGDLEAAQATMTCLQAMGIAWSLDDFGTGYSSLSHLHRLQVDTLKIDRSFVSRMGLDDHGSEMVRAVISLAHTLGMDVVAEGVETVEQLAQLDALGCDYAQGFLFAKAVEAAQADHLIASQPWREDAERRLAKASIASAYPFR
jgi:EAL domain-containing protein (putative c-di-GMP-specific phosphodiesterase class I)